MTQFCGDDIAFTMEASCGVAAGVNDMLLQGWNDTVRVFPAVPAHWRDIAFRELVTEGAFTVSAIRRNGRTVSVIVRATVARRLRLRDPFAGADVSMSGAALVREGDCFVGPMNAGEEVVLCLEGDTCDIDAAVATVRASDTSRLGLRA